MWDCKYRTIEDDCLRREAKCLPGEKGCVLQGKYEFPFREDAVKQCIIGCEFYPKRDVKKTK